MGCVTWSATRFGWPKKALSQRNKFILLPFRCKTSMGNPTKSVDEFFQWNCPKSDEDFALFADQLRIHASSTRRRGFAVPMSIQILDQWSPRNTIRPLSSSMQCLARQFSDGPNSDLPLETDGLNVMLTSAIQTGREKWAQVWRGSMKIKAFGDSRRCVPVAVKIFQESLFPPPRSLRNIIVHKGWSFGAQFSKAEAEAYFTLHHMQGTCSLLLVLNVQLLGSHRMHLGNHIPQSYVFLKVYL